MSGDVCELKTPDSDLRQLIFHKIFLLLFLFDLMCVCGITLESLQLGTVGVERSKQFLQSLLKLKVRHRNVILYPCFYFKVESI